MIAGAIRAQAPGVSINLLTNAAIEGIPAEETAGVNVIETPERAHMARHLGLASYSALIVALMKTALHTAHSSNVTDPRYLRSCP